MNRLLRLGACLSLIATLLVATVLGAPARVIAQDGAITGSLQSIAHGVATLPADALAWRVVVDEVTDRDGATPTTQSLGFTLATDGAVLVESPTAGTQDVLALGSAAFVAEGASETRSGIDGPTGYDRIALVTADLASDAGTGELVLAGEGFGSPAGNRTLELSRAVLAPGQSVVSPAPDSPTPSLVLATDGSVDATFGGETFTLTAGTAAVLDGELTIATVDGGTAVVATIGAEVPVLETDAVTTETVTPVASDDATPAPSTAGTPAAGDASGDGIDQDSGDDTGTGSGAETGGDVAGTGSLDISVLDCSGGSLLDTTTCAPLEGVTVTVAIAESQQSVETGGVTDGSGAITLAEVAVGAAVTISNVSGGPEGLELLNVPFAIPAFEGDTIVPIVFDAPAEEPAIEAPATEIPATGATPVVGGEPATGETPAGVPAVLTIQALDCRDGDLATLEGCVAMPNATFSVTRGTDTVSSETGFTTDANGFVTFSAEVGSAVTATYAFGAPTGVAPNNDGQVLEPIDGDATLTFVFVDINESVG